MRTDRKHQLMKAEVGCEPHQVPSLLTFAPMPSPPPFLLLILTTLSIQCWGESQGPLLTTQEFSHPESLLIPTPNPCPTPATDIFEAPRQFASQECSRIWICHPSLNRCCFPLEIERAVFFFSLQTTQHGVFCYSNWGWGGRGLGEED